MFDRLKLIISKEEFRRIRNLNILLIGIGGVGGYVFESLLRSGIEKITVVDYDNFEITNMNRQLYCTNSTLTNSKVEEALKRANLINPMAKINALNQKLMIEDISSEFLDKYDFIIDACDDVEVKIKLIETCSKNSKKLISCMGTGNRFHPEMLELSKLKDTINDPLARKIRQKLNKNHQALQTPVVWSKEIPVKGVGLGTFCPVPMAAGALLASYIIKK